MRIQHNIAAMNSYRNFSANTSSLNKNLEKLSTGYKINRAGDDAAGLAISEKMRAQISGLEGATKNAKDGISLVQTAEGALTEVHDMLNRMTTLAEQSANGTYQDELDREQLQKEVSQLKSEIDRIADSTNFNGLKLLDGGLTETTQAIELSGSVNSTSNLDMTDGVTINAPINGAGANQTYSMEFKAGTLFGAGDRFSFDYLDTKTSARTTTTMTYSKDIAAANVNVQFNGDTLKDQLNSIAAALNNSTTNVEGAAYKNGYTASVEMNDDGSGKLVLTANEAGAPSATFSNLSITDKQAASVTATTADTGTAGTRTALQKAGWDLLGSSGAPSTGTHPFDVQAGDTLTFEFNVNGKTMYAKITEGEDFSISQSGNVNETTKNIVDALKNAHFLNPKEGEQIVPAGTLSGSTGTYTEIKAAAAGETGGTLGSAAPVETLTMDESQLKVGDYFTLTANHLANGQVRADVNADFATAGGWAAVGSAYLTKSEEGGGGTTKLAAKVGTATGDANGAITEEGTAEVNTVNINHDGTEATNQNMSVGEKFAVNGTLADGRKFSIELTAVKEGTATADLKENTFAIGQDGNGSTTTDTARQATATNIVDALKSSNNTVTVTDANGNVEEISADKLFKGTSGTDFSVSASGTTITFTNVQKGTTGTGLAADIDITKTGINAGDAITSELKTDAVGKEQSKTQNVLTFDADKIEQGTTMEIDGKTYEFVTDAAYTTHDDNVAVVVDNLGDGATGEELANALVSAMSNDAENPGVYTAAAGNDYSMSVSGNTLTITSDDVGEEVEALDIAMGANKATSILNLTATDKSTLEKENFVANVKAGDTVKIGGRTYEFTEGHRTTAEGNIQVDLLDDNGDKMTDAGKIAQKLADVVNKEANTVSGDNPAIVARAKGTQVIFTGKYNASAASGEDGYAAPGITLSGGTRKLKLQIGDTADDYNQLSVEVGDMHAEALGIGDVDVSTQAGATEALDKIKAAVNQVSDVRGTLGSLQNRLDHTINNLGVMRENIQNAESQIRDTDVAEEMMAYTKNSILNQSAQAMLAQANQLPQGVLQLLG